ncbi:MAG TPA: DUF2817 domain-containing protein [Burkholderiales bacterium]
MELDALFSPDYAMARDRFRSAAQAAGATPEALALEARGPGGEALTIDIARLGAPGARRVLLHTCGLHGVEAFAGSAVQLAALADSPDPPEDCALVLVHVLNPYGMAWLRRANENNVDLNRNFPAPGEGRTGAPALYARLDPLLNPAAATGRERFRWKLATAVLRHGLRAVTQAIAEGQYEFPRGLFFGGSKLESGPALYLDWLRSNLAHARTLFALDFHTGLGRHGEEMLVLEPGVSATPAPELERAFHRRVLDPAMGRATYRTRGGMGGALPRTLPGVRIDFVLQEIGTRHPLAVLHALREENRWHQHGRAAPTHPAKQALRDALCPPSPRWRRQALERGLALLRAAAAWTWYKS